MLIQEVGVSPALARQEVERYTFLQPGGATTYFAGYVALLELRAEVEEHVGAAFAPRAFHDLILRQGFLDPHRVRDQVLTVLGCAGEPLCAA